MWNKYVEKDSKRHLLFISISLFSENLFCYNSDVLITIGLYVYRWWLSRQLQTKKLGLRLSSYLILLWKGISWLYSHSFLFHFKFLHWEFPLIQRTSAVLLLSAVARLPLFSRITLIRFIRQKFQLINENNYLIYEKWK